MQIYCSCGQTIIMEFNLVVVKDHVDRNNNVVANNHDVMHGKCCAHYESIKFLMGKDHNFSLCARFVHNRGNGHSYPRVQNGWYQRLYTKIHIAIVDVNNIETKDQKTMTYKHDIDGQRGCHQIVWGICLCFTHLHAFNNLMVVDGFHDKARCDLVDAKTIKPRTKESWPQSRMPWTKTIYPWPTMYGRQQ